MFLLLLVLSAAFLTAAGVIYWRKNPGALSDAWASAVDWFRRQSGGDK